jgi:hypothetical protein
MSREVSSQKLLGELGQATSIGNMKRELLYIRAADFLQ